MLVAPTQGFTVLYHAKLNRKKHYIKWTYVHNDFPILAQRIEYIYLKEQPSFTNMV